MIRVAEIEGQIRQVAFAAPQSLGSHTGTELSTVRPHA
jgi:hypothetical protein